MHTTLKKVPPSLPLHTGYTLHCIVHRPSPPLVTVYWHAAGIVKKPLICAGASINVPLVIIVLLLEAVTLIAF
ncbi:hypothetical protein P692DRAFT_20836667 [Suillus brevipes Sb2]|nr:hypothetical protein P692DRAFT_20836667 [Suillus brevipes Sb2]